MTDVLFVCVHNAGRSQMAMALFNAMAQERGSRLRADSAGTQPGSQINPLAVAAMEELGISLSDASPKLLTAQMARETPKLITMGCGVEASACPAGVYFSEDWGLDDPAGKDFDEVRRIRNAIKERVAILLESMETGG